MLSDAAPRTAACGSESTHVDEVVEGANDVGLSGIERVDEGGRVSSAQLAALRLGVLSGLGDEVCHGLGLVVDALRPSDR